MAERLPPAQIALSEAGQALSEAQVVLANRVAWRDAQAATVERGEADPSLLHRAEAQVSKAILTRDAAARRRIAAARRVTTAQADYDSTREGLHDLREAYDREPHHSHLQTRMLIALHTYETEAARRDATFGPQCPLASIRTTDAGVGKAMRERGMTGWLKTAPSPDERTGLSENRVNLVWREGTRRRSLTLPYLSEQPIRRTDPVAVDMQGQPTLDEVATRFETQMQEVNQVSGSYPTWLEWQEQHNSLAMRQRWRAALQVERSLTPVVSQPDQQSPVSAGSATQQ